MKKYIIFLLLILTSCHKDDLYIEPQPQKEMIFEMVTTKITDGQEINFIVTSTEKHILVILQNNSVISKESFIPTNGLNTRKIYTKSIPNGIYTLKLYSNQLELNSVDIILE